MIKVFRTILLLFLLVVTVPANAKNSDGTWQQIMTTPGFIGKNGLGKTKEGDGMTPVGTFHFDKAFGVYHYQYCLNISYNDAKIPGVGSAIFVSL